MKSEIIDNRQSTIDNRQSPISPRAVLTACPAATRIDLSVLKVIDMKSTAKTDLASSVKSSRDVLDSWVREVVQWHFDPDTGSPFWLDYAKTLDWDPRRE